MKEMILSQDKIIRTLPFLGDKNEAITATLTKAKNGRAYLDRAAANVIIARLNTIIKVAVTLGQVTKIMSSMEEIIGTNISDPVKKLGYSTIVEYIEDGIVQGSRKTTMGLR